MWRRLFDYRFGFGRGKTFEHANKGKDDTHTQTCYASFDVWFDFLHKKKRGLCVMRQTIMFLVSLEM